MNPISRALHRRMKDQSGFTMTELLVVIVIAGILAAIAIPVWRGQQRKSYMNDNRVAVANARLAIQNFISKNDDTTYGLTMPDAGKCYWPKGSATDPTSCKIGNSKISIPRGVKLDIQPKNQTGTNEENWSNKIHFEVYNDYLGKQCHYEYADSSVESC